MSDTVEVIVGIVGRAHGIKGEKVDATAAIEAVNADAEKAKAKAAEKAAAAKAEAPAEPAEGDEA